MGYSRIRDRAGKEVSALGGKHNEPNHQVHLLALNQSKCLPLLIHHQLFSHPGCQPGMCVVLGE